MMRNAPRVPKCTEWMQTTKVVSSRFMCWGLGELSGFDSTNWRPLFPRRGHDGCGGCGGVVLVMVVLMVVLVKKMTLVPTDDDPCFAFTAPFSHITSTSVPKDLYTNIPTVTKSIIYEDPPQ